MIYLKTMNRLKKFWIVFLSFLPFSAGAVAPFVVGTIAGVGVIAGFSIYRTAVPVDMADALSFFSSCWTCQIFSDVMATISGLLPRVYNAIGAVIVPFSAGLMALWFAWKLFSGFINAKIEEPWSIVGDFGTKFIKLAFVSALLMVPLPRLLTDIVIEPVFNVGLSLNRVVAGDDGFAECVVATAIADPVSVSSDAASDGAFSPRLRHNLACELANVHQMTGLGMTVGWTMLNMAFDEEYMHKIMWDIPIFPQSHVCGVLYLFCRHRLSDKVADHVCSACDISDLSSLDHSGRRKMVPREVWGDVQGIHEEGQKVHMTRTFRRNCRGR